jgi:Ca2+/Na+ antiporter
MIAAKNSEYADSAVGNVTGSNSVNVFLGLGAPWVMASTYMEGKGKEYLTPPGNLAYSVVIFISCSLIAFAVLAIRRKVVGGELGGPRGSAMASCAFFIFLWTVYITLSIVKATSGWP